MGSGRRSGRKHVPFRPDLCRHCQASLKRGETNETPAYDGPCARCRLCAAQANAEELTGTLKKIKETGVITIGYRDSSIPFSYLDDNQKPVGFAIDICLTSSTR